MSNEVVFEYTRSKEKRDVPKDVTIVRLHSCVTEVSSFMFHDCRQLKEVVFNEGLRKIGYGSFYNCKVLQSITLPSTLIEVGKDAFHYCTSLREVVLNEGLQKLDINSFYGCASLKSITLPSTVSKIGMNAFNCCTNLKTVTLNESLQTIGHAAFVGCISLESITIPPTVTEISGTTFYICRRLREVGLHEGIQIASDAFAKCTSLERFTFPKLSFRLDTIIQAGKYVNVENKIDNIRDLVERSDSDLFISATPRLYLLAKGQHWKGVKEALGRIDRLLTYYELKEATTLLELAMWKSKMDQAEEASDINRDLYRIDIPGPVKNTILQYLNFRV